jgi:murein DD-endopeptidase MepM/ murein hydrolase activator NlpD
MQDFIPYYDPDTCRFVNKRGDYFVTLRETCAWALASFLVTCLTFVTFVWLIGSPWEFWLDTQNKQLSEDLVEIQTQMKNYAVQIDAMSHRDQELYRTFLETQPIPEHVLKMGVGGSLPHSSFNLVDTTSQSTLLSATVETADSLERRISLQKESYRHLTRLVDDYQESLPQKPAILPANGPVISGYGMRWHPIYHQSRMHQGIDIQTRTGTPVFATGDGTITHAGRDGGYGLCIRIKHPATGYETRYAHLSAIPEDIRPGVTVDRGELIGYSGNTGLSTGPHLHYEVRDAEGEALNPVHFFVPEMTPRAYHTIQPIASFATAAIDSTAG